MNSAYKEAIQLLQLVAAKTNLKGRFQSTESSPLFSLKIESGIELFGISMLL